MRVQQVRRIGALEGDEPVTANRWEEIKRSEQGVKNWINENLKGKSCLVVLIGSETASRKWVQYEIQQAWGRGMAVVGIYIHRLRCPRGGYAAKGSNPFDLFEFTRGDRVVKPLVFTPSFSDAYNDIAENIEDWIEQAINQKG